MTAAPRRKLVGMGYIQLRDETATNLASRLAERLGTSEEEAIAKALAAFEANLDRYERNPDASEKLKKFWREHPLPPPTGLKADKAFFDDLSGDL